MAHSCPRCWQTCYCGGDIDDICFDGDAPDCTHCPTHDADNEEGCCFPEECLMPGPHLRSECHNVEMMEEFDKEMEA